MKILEKAESVISMSDSAFFTYGFVKLMTSIPAKVEKGAVH
ncbi:hypothetical protein [Bacillus salacetis]|nr:hypothetical protein [Bacillus salacetis]